MHIGSLCSPKAARSLVTQAPAFSLWLTPSYLFLISLAHFFHFLIQDNSAISNPVLEFSSYLPSHTSRSFSFKGLLPRSQ